jgi:hypothetical protein
MIRIGSGQGPQAELRWAFAFLTALVAFAGPVHRASATGPNNQTVFSNDFSVVTNNHDTPVTDRKDNFSVTIEGVLNGTQTLYSQTFSVPFADATVQQAVATAESVLTSAGGTSPTGPTLTADATILQSSLTTTIETGRTAVAATAGQIIVTTTVGPATVDLLQFPINPGTLVGSVDPAILLTLKEVPIFGGAGDHLAGGQVDVNVDQPIFLTIDRNIVTTNTFLTSQTYLITATTQSGPPTVPLPAAAWQALIGLAVVQMLRLMWRDKKIAL